LQDSIISSVMEANSIFLPANLLQGDFLTELERKLQIGNLTVISTYFKSLANDVDKTLSTPDLEALFSEIVALEKEISSTDPNILQEGDKKILQFLKSTRSGILDFLRLAGPIYSLSELMGKIEKNKDLDRVIVATMAIYTFQNLYELLLQNIDARLLLYLQDPESSVTGNFDKFKEVDRNDGDHATAGLINQMFVQLRVIEQADKSIFSGETKRLRNKAAHFNIYYDSRRDRFFFPKGEALDFDGFLRLLGHLYMFLVEWLQSSMGLKFQGHDVAVAKLKEEFKNSCLGISRAFLAFSRAGYQKRYGLFIIQLLNPKEQ